MSVFEYESIMRSVAFLLFGIHLTSGTHSLQSFHTVVSRLIDLPEFTVVRTVDDQQFMYFDSNTMKAVPKTEYIRQNEGAEYWDKQTQRVINHYLEYKNMMNVIQHVGAEKEIVMLMKENTIPCNPASGNIFAVVVFVVGCVVALTVLSALIALIKWAMSTKVKSSNSTGYVKGSATDTDPKSDKPEAETISLEHYVDF